MTDVPPTLFPGGDVPGRDWSVGQTLRFDPTYLRSKLPSESMWPDELTSLPSGGGKYLLVSRQDVFSIADRAAAEGDPTSAAQLHVAIVAWGASEKAQRIARGLFPLHEPGASEKLSKALNLV